MTVCMGLMSGTSMDGIDAALVESPSQVLLKGITRPYPKELAADLRAVMTGLRLSPGALSQLSTRVGRAFAETAKEILALTSVDPKKILIIGSHGQTICHDTSGDIPYTVQLGCGHTIAQETGIDVVADLRARDLVLGGQGAPFAPLYHQAIFSGTTRAIVNIGGISNVTYLFNTESVRGHDVGPGNCLLDAWVQLQLGHSYDECGQWAVTGTVLPRLLSALRDDPYFKRPAPKSVGREYFSSAWLSKYLIPTDSAEDVQATLLALTVSTICDDIQASGLLLEEVLVCGGGVHNQALLEALQARLPALPIISTANYGIDPDFIEAMMCAWIAEKTISRIPLDFRCVTGATHPTLMGAIYPA